MINFVGDSNNLARDCTFDTSLLQLKDLVAAAKHTKPISEDCAFDNPAINKALHLLTEQLDRPICKAALGYVSGFVVHKLLVKFKCSYCRIHVFANTKSLEFSELIAQKNIR